MKQTQQIGFGGGCHWCTEAVFQQVQGVHHVRQGYIASNIPFNTFSEAVLIEFDDNIPLERLVDIHLQTHASTSDHSRREEYRSAIYFFNQEQMELVECIMSSLSRKRNENYITQLLAFKSFKASRESIQNYYSTRPEAPFCKRYIKPKLELVKKIQLQ